MKERLLISPLPTIAIINQRRRSSPIPGYVFIEQDATLDSAQQFGAGPCGRETGD
jgi:hypothetical protein